MIKPIRPLAALSLAFCLTAALHAQEQLEADVPDVPVGAASAAEGVYVRDSSAAADQFALADRLASLGEWARAAETLRNAADNARPDALVAAAGDERGRVVQFRPVADAVRRRLAGWPVEGRDAYRQRYDAEADRLLIEARRLDPRSPERLDRLDALWRRHLLARAGTEAAIELADRRLADGDAAAANRLLGVLLDAHPDLETLDFRPDVLARAATAARLAGDAGRADALADELGDARDSRPHRGCRAAGSRGGDGRADAAARVRGRAAADGVADAGRQRRAGSRRPAGRRAARADVRPRPAAGPTRRATCRAAPSPPATTTAARAGR